MKQKELQQFAKEVDAGLSDSPKRLSSKWFYDKNGDRLFVKIMNTPEYYPYRAELEIFTTKSQLLATAISFGNEYFELIELGAGDGSKTIHLLKAIKYDRFTYMPIDISDHTLRTLSERLMREVPQVEVQPKCGEYFQVLDSISSPHPKAILFLGSNIGNLLDEKANEFLCLLAKKMKAGDKLLLGADLKKPAHIVLPAYNDSQGITAAFNLNLLTRINRELGGNFNVEAFEHLPEYDENEGVAKSYLQSTCDQEVYISAIDKTFAFKKGERILMEISRKYDEKAIARIVNKTGLSILDRFYDSNSYFCDILFKKE
ncbi:MAG: L-histidine N(alpha)-methyltransferase [Salibacteraceae bacterium]